MWIVLLKADKLLNSITDGDKQYCSIRTQLFQQISAFLYVYATVIHRQLVRSGVAMQLVESGHVPSWRLREIFRRLYVESSCLVCFGTMLNSNSALFVQLNSLLIDAITCMASIKSEWCVYKNCFYSATSRVSAMFAVDRCPSLRMSATFV